MRRRDFLVGAAAAAVVPDGGAVLTPDEALYGTGEMLRGLPAARRLNALRLDLAHRIANPPLILSDGTLRRMSTAADERAFWAIDRLIGDDRSS